MVYPYVILGYLSYYDLWSEMALFELVMLGTYICLQVLILLLGIPIFRTHYFLWHILPGEWTNEWPSDLSTFKEKMYKFYDSARWTPVIENMMTTQLGSDIGVIVMDYVDSIELDESALEHERMLDRIDLLIMRG